MLEYEAGPPLWSSRVSLQAEYTVNVDGEVTLTEVFQVSNGKEITRQLSEEQEYAIKEAAFAHYLMLQRQRGDYRDPPHYH